MESPSVEGGAGIEGPFATETTACVVVLPNIHPTTLCSGVPCALLDSAKNLEELW